MTVQAVLFDTNFYTTADARQWLYAHDLKPIKRGHRTRNYLRYRINEPDPRKRYRSIRKGDGILMIITF